MKAWLKGGVIGIGVFVVFIIIALILDGLGEGAPTWLSLPLISGFLFTNFASYQIRDFVFINGLISVIIYFLVGAFIGWIIGKIKSKK